jgi:pSer/pThr/pTyr-binding forkhead associated (FHA) protein
MARPLPNTVIWLQFSPDFPATIAGELIELDSNKKGDAKSDSFYILGKVPYADIQFLPPEGTEIRKHFQAISRIQCTLRYDKKYKLWGILDGGVYLSEKDTQSGDEDVVKSKNGVYVNGLRIRANDWHTIQPGDRVHFGNDKKIVVYNSPNPTLDEYIWLPENWICRGTEEVSSTPIEAAEQLIEHTKNNANPSPTPSTTPWGLLGKIFDWFVTPSKSRETQFIKISLVGFAIAFLLSDEFQHLLSWFFHKN